jgi:hypothetical protein
MALIGVLKGFISLPLETFIPKRNPSLNAKYRHKKSTIASPALIMAVCIYSPSFGDNIGGKPAFTTASLYSSRVIKPLLKIVTNNIMSINSTPP